MTASDGSPISRLVRFAEACGNDPTETMRMAGVPSAADIDHHSSASGSKAGFAFQGFGWKAL